MYERTVLSLLPDCTCNPTAITGPCCHGFPDMMDSLLGMCAKLTFSFLSYTYQILCQRHLVACEATKSTEEPDSWIAQWESVNCFRKWPHSLHVHRQSVTLALSSPAYSMSADVGWVILVGWSGSLWCDLHVPWDTWSRLVFCMLRCHLCVFLVKHLLRSLSHFKLSCFLVAELLIKDFYEVRVLPVFLLFCDSFP